MFSPAPPATFGCETDGCISSVAPQEIHQDTCRQHVFTRRHAHTCRRMCSHASIANAPRGENARTFSLSIHCARAQNTDDNCGLLRVINDILIASLPGSSPTGRPHAGRDALRHPEMLAMGSKPRNSLPDIQNLAKELIAAKCASAMQSGPAAQCCPTLLRFQTDNDRRCAWPFGSTSTTLTSFEQDCPLSPGGPRFRIGIIIGP